MSQRRLVVGASAFLLLVAGGACAPEKSQTSTATTALSWPPTTTTLDAGTTPFTTGIPGGCPSGIGEAAQSAPQAARCMYEAWKAGDRETAAAFASLDIVDALFRQRWSPPDGTFNGCAADPDTGGQACSFDHHGAAYVFGARRSEGGWRVTQVQLPPHGG